jgi:hypothetical protein
MPELFYSASQKYLDTSQFDRLGHPGKYTQVYKHTGGEFYFTGSNYGYGAMMIGSGSVAEFVKGDDNFISLSGGGDIPIMDLLGGADGVSQNAPTIFDISVAYVTSSAVEHANIYFFKRQQ